MNEHKASVQFTTHFHSHELSRLELPVEIRDAKMHLKMRTLTTKREELPPGEYFFISRLPAGQIFEAYIDLKSGESRTVELKPEDVDESPSESLEVQHFLRRSVKQDERSIAMGNLPYSSEFNSNELEAVPFAIASPFNFAVECQWYVGNLLADDPKIKSIRTQRFETIISRPLDIDIPLELGDVLGPVVCQLRQPDRPHINVRIPVFQIGPQPTISLLIPEPTAPAYRIGIRLFHQTADLLTRYMRRSMFSEASESIASDSMSSEYLLLNKNQDPIAAAVGSYTLLRLGELSSLHEWTANLMTLFPSFPDGAAIRGEHEARRGNHLEACRAFLQLEQRGLPLFTDGLSYALDRLRLYHTVSSKLAGLESFEREAISRLARKLEQLIPFIDFDRTYVTYTDPTKRGMEDVKQNDPTDASASQHSSSIPLLHGENDPMSDENPSDQEFFFNGIDATTGEHLEAPKSAKQLAAIALSDPALTQSPFAIDNNMRHLRELYYRSQANKTQAFGARFGVDVGNVATAGWAVVFARDADPGIREALRPLLDLRKEQAGRFYRECHGLKGYSPGESKDDFLTRNGTGPGPADPERFPFYVLLVGDPESIPFKFQYQFDVIYAVGRIWFETVEEYSRYAQTVVHAESGKVKLSRQATFFGPQNPNDRATKLSAEQLLIPLANRAEQRGLASNWKIDRVIGDDATRSRLSEYLGGAKTPALLFTASHGMGFPLNDDRQKAYQGALLCQDWNGPGTGPIDRSHYFAAEDIVDSAKVAGLICFHFACYGAGTPRLDDFAYQQFQSPKAIASKSFVAALPRRLLGHPSAPWLQLAISNVPGDVPSHGATQARRFKRLKTPSTF